MINSTRIRLGSLLLLIGLALLSSNLQAQQKKIVIVAGKPSHPPRMHEFNAGVQLLAKCLVDSPLKPEFVLNGWPKDEAVFKDAAAIIFYMDGGRGHEVVKEDGRRMKLVDDLAKSGVGIGMMHYGVEVVADQAGAEFKRWIGGHYEHEWSCNPIWEANFETFPDHPICRGVKPFKVKDEWYFNMRFAGDIAGNQPTEVNGLKFTPILVSKPSDETRDGPYVYPKGPYKQIQENKGRAEAMMWVVERPDGGRGMGFTGGHFHDNWANDNFRKAILNSFFWLAKLDVPANGVESLTAADINANLDPKGK
ncbi:MAG: ThuA domain-containing protein [Pirellulales bacterium]